MSILEHIKAESKYVRESDTGAALTMRGIVRGTLYNWNLSQNLMSSRLIVDILSYRKHK